MGKMDGEFIGTLDGGMRGGGNAFHPLRWGRVISTLLYLRRRTVMRK